MAVLNVHTRQLPAPVAEVGALIDSLSGSADRLWPGKQWPPMLFDRPLEVGAVGGHGPVRYTVEGYQPGRLVRFRFTGPRGFDGFHEFTAHSMGANASELRHVLVVKPRGPARLGWPLAYRWMHDACVEDSFDRAELELTGTVRQRARWSWYVRVLHAIAGRQPQRAEVERQSA